MSKPPLLQMLAFDPILANVKLIAEAWDAGGLYQVGSFPHWSRWSEWNGRYRDDLRCFLKGDSGLAAIVADRLAGSHDLYDPLHRGKNASINFITCHDGFTLHDLYCYNEKHNEANGWAIPTVRTTTTAGTAAPKVRRTTLKSTGCANVWSAMP